ncbi:MAG TPA: bifunctional glycosyltransferase/class I SAM-dependent methyltransferase [Acidimicrobiia bacterium]
MKRIGILIVAYNAASTLAHVLDRIPRDFVPRIDRVLVTDDASTDATYLVGLGYGQTTDLPLTVIRQPENLGYGGNQKAAYKWAMEHDLDIVVLLHGDGQYAPEILPEIVAPLELDKCDAVFGSRMMHPGEARRGGMPLYKYFGNKILTRFENAVVGMDLSEWHSGYRAYNLAALRDIPFEANSNGFDFDTQIIVQLHEAGKRIEEVPIPTYYGDEICYVDGIQYARDIVEHVTRYRFHKMGFGTGETAFASDAYESKEGDETSHGRLVAWLAARPRSRILDLGCSDGSLAERLRVYGHEVTAVDREEHAGVRDRVHRFVVGDLDDGIPDAVGDGYDVVLAADVLEHVRRPEQLLADARDRLAPGGSIVASVPNFAHWYPRTRVVLGRFDYDRRGILDHDHVRFFTRRSFERLAKQGGLTVRRREAVGLPLEVAERGRRARTAADGRATRAGGLASRLDRLGVALAPTLFAYQFLFELEPQPEAVSAAPA